MSLPSVSITFTDAARTLIARTDRGVVGIILKDAVTAVNPAVITSVDEIPSTYSDLSKRSISMALTGYERSPLRVVAYAVGAEAEDYSAALDYFAGIKIDWLCAPSAKTDNQVDAIKAWVINQRSAEKSKVKAVLPNCAADDEGIVNFATGLTTDGENDYTAEQMCPRIAGIFASVPLTMSATYAELPEMTGCSSMSRTELEAADTKGEFIVFWDGEKVKTGRAVNSLQTTSKVKGDQWKKVRVVSIMDIIRSDLTELIEDNYIGRYSNSYDNKCVLIGAVSSYFDNLIQETALDSAAVSLNLDKIKAYLKEQGIDVSTMTDTEIRQHRTGSYVFLQATIGILDAIEDIVLDITV